MENFKAHMTKILVMTAATTAPATFTTEWIDLQVGIAMGCTISPILFVMAMKIILDAAIFTAPGPILNDKTTVPALRAFMDDTTILTPEGIVFPLIALACQTSYDFTSWTDILDSVKAICVVIGICAPILGKFDVRDVRNAGTVLAFLIFCALVTCVDILVYTQTFMSGKRYCVDKEMYMYICDAISLLWEILALFMYLLVISAYHKYSHSLQTRCGFITEANLTV